LRNGIDDGTSSSKGPAITEWSYSISENRTELS
jgi:hypothetical protein